MNNFVWAELSTYNTTSSIRFYENVFGWQFSDSGDYFVGHHGGAEVAGLFETPEKFKKINMPCFWMSYIAVEDAEQTAKLAAEFEGATLELVDDFYDGKIALIRDPQGAGFTVYDGGKLDCKKVQAGHLIWNELHVSNAETVIPFYRRLLNWDIRPMSENSYAAINTWGEHVTDIVVLPNEIKGQYEYWICTFGVAKLEKSKNLIQENGGSVVLDEGERLLMSDNTEEAFFYIQQVG